VNCHRCSAVFKQAILAKKTVLHKEETLSDHFENDPSVFSLMSIEEAEPEIFVHLSSFWFLFLSLWNLWNRCIAN
jgi:hypothetical protein